MIHDFSLFNTLGVSSTKENHEDKCEHIECVDVDGVDVCVDCGIEVLELQSNSDVYTEKYVCRKNIDKGILKDIEHLNISPHIVEIANQLYLETCKEPHRRTLRRGIIFACLFHAYNIDNNPQSCEELLKLLNLKKKDALRGLTHVSEKSPKTSPVHTTYLTPSDLIQEFLLKFKITLTKKTAIINIYNKVKNQSNIFHRSRPQSIAAGVIWYWICQNNINISIREFIENIKLSEITIKKMAKEVAKYA